MCRLRNFSNTLLPRFLYYGINKYLKEIEDATAFTTVKHLSSKSVLSIDFPHPPLPEQQRIVTKLDAAFGALREAEGHVERNRANARELFESYSNGIHQGNSPKWIDTRVGDEVEIFTGFPFKSDRYTEAENDIRLLRGDNIIPGEFRWEGVKRWPADDVKEYGAYWLDEGDVVIAMDRTWIKSGLKYAIVAKADIPSLLVQRVARLRCKPSLDKRYLGYLIASRDFATYVLSVQTGTGVPHISGGQIAEFEFRRPPIEEQRLIAEKLDALKAETKQLEATYQQKLRELEGLKKGLLGAAFRGEL